MFKFLVYGIDQLTVSHHTGSRIIQHFFFCLKILFYSNFLEVEVDGADVCLEFYSKGLLHTYTLLCACRIAFVHTNAYFWQIHVVILLLFVE